MKKSIDVNVTAPQFSVVTGVTFSQVDAWFGHSRRDLKLDIIYPEDRKYKYPCVVWICGGAWLTMDKSAHLYYLSALARRGFAVASVEYRTSNEAKYPAPIEDVQAGIRYLRKNAVRFNIDPERFGVMGESAGGYLTCMAALDMTPENRVQAACPWYPPTDFRGFPYPDAQLSAAAPESLLMGKNVLLNPEETLAACPVSRVTPDAPPFLIIHGDCDRTVPYAQGVLLHDALEKAGCDVTLLTVKGGDHADIRFFQDAVWSEIGDFFAEKLR